MKYIRPLVILVALLVAGGLWPSHTQAAINPMISFQGKLTNTDGTNVTDGSYSIRFRMYTDPTQDASNACLPGSNTCKWEETQGTVTVSAGIFHVNLGSSTTLPGSVDFNTSALYLGIKVSTDAEMTPRVRLTAAPYAFNSDLLDGLDSSALAQLSPSGQQTGSLNISGTITSGAVNGITIGSTIQPSASGALTVQSSGANALGLDTGGAAAINVGATNATSINIGNATSNPNISFNGSGTFGTTTGAVSLNGNVTIASTKSLTLTSGSFSQTYSTATASNAHSISITNSNTGAGVTVQGIHLTPTNTDTPSSGTNTLNVINFAAGGALGGGDTTNGINFASPTGYTNFINSPSFVVSSGGAVSGITTLATSSTINSNTFNSSTLTFGAASTATVQSAGSQALTLTGNAASTWSTTAGNLTIQAGSGTVSLGSSTILNSSGALTINSASASSLTIDSGTTGALNFGTGSNAKTITIGNTTGATAIAHLVGTGTNVFNVQGPSSAVYLQLDSTNNRLYIGNPTADGTAFLLVLDSKNTTGDPTGVAGAQYYNSANDRFRCYQGGAWTDCVSSGSVANFRYFSDFTGSPTTTGQEMFATNSTGTVTSQATSATNRPGVFRFSTAGSATGRADYSSAASALSLGAGRTIFETAINIATLSNSTDRYQLVIGLHDTMTAANQTDAVAFVYDEGGVSTGSAASANWQLVTASNSTRTWTTTSTAVAAGSWIKLRIDVNAAGTSVTFYINGTSVGTQTTNIPTGTTRALGFGALLIKSVGTTARTVDFDYMDTEQDYSSAR